MSAPYDFRAIESEVQLVWEKNDAFRAEEEEGREKYYCLCMLPYPSGSLHMGHVRNYTIGDVLSRYKRMQGFNVLQPMGWDAFGLPAENAAIKNNTAPAKWTYANIEEMREQLTSLGFAYDWSREVTTCRPEYYRWEQWFFTKLFEKGLAYRKMAVVNWDPVEQTVLANEQVDAEGRGWRSGAKVERREIPQWFLKITDYTTRPDTVAGVTYMAVAAEHPIARAASKYSPEVAAFIKSCADAGTSEAALDTLEKRGVPLGYEALNPVTGERVPVWCANFVLMGYGTGAVMAVPGHDQRDWEFATKFGLPIKQVIQSTTNPVDLSESAFLDKRNTVTINSGAFDGLAFEEAFEKTAEHLVSTANGAKKVNYRIRDWGVSRQRYWGCPIPIIYDEDGTPHAVPESDLPIKLPEDVAFSGVNSPIKSDPGFYETTVPGSDKPGTRETDTFDTFFESSWYYARYCSPDADSMLDERANYWLPVDQYIGGIEHAVLHLLYARFFHKLMRDAGVVTSDEPFTRLLTQGMVIAETFYRDDEGKPEYFTRDELELERDDKGRISAATLKADGKPVTVGRIEKMSKSKSNGVDPLAMIARYGADTVRLFSMSDSPPHQSLEWKEGGVEGMHRFLKRVWREIDELDAVDGDFEQEELNEAEQDLRRKTHETIGKVTDDIERRMTFNTAIASMMELFNELSRFKPTGDNGRAVAHEAASALVRLLQPFVPHVTHVLWEKLGYTTALMNEAWPEVDEEALVRDAITLVVQVNGKRRAEVSVASDASKEACEQAAMENESVRRHIGDATVRKVIVVPGRLVNIVAN